MEYVNKAVLIVEGSKHLRKVVRDELERNSFMVIETDRFREQRKLDDGRNHHPCQSAPLDGVNTLGELE